MYLLVFVSQLYSNETQKQKCYVHFLVSVHNCIIIKQKTVVLVFVSQFKKIKHRVKDVVCLSGFLFHNCIVIKQKIKAVLVFLGFYVSRLCCN